MLPISISNTAQSSLCSLSCNRKFLKLFLPNTSTDFKLIVHFINTLIIFSQKLTEPTSEIFHAVKQNYCFDREKSHRLSFSVLPYINSFPRSMHLCNILKKRHQPLCGITCNDDLHKSKESFSTSFSQPNLTYYLYFPIAGRGCFSFTDHNLQSLIPKGTTQVLCLQLSSQVLYKHLYWVYVAWVRQQVGRQGGLCEKSPEAAPCQIRALSLAKDRPVSEVVGQ